MIGAELRNALARITSYNVCYTKLLREVIELVRAEAESLGIPFSLNEKGGALLTLKGSDSSRRIALSAHIDTLGAMVRSYNFV